MTQADREELVRASTVTAAKIAGLQWLLVQKGIATPEEIEEASAKAEAEIARQVQRFADELQMEMIEEAWRERTKLYRTTPLPPASP